MIFVLVLFEHTSYLGLVENGGKKHILNYTFVVQRACTKSTRNASFRIITNGLWIIFRRGKKHRTLQVSDRHNNLSECVPQDRKGKKSREKKRKKKTDEFEKRSLGAVNVHLLSVALRVG